MEREEFVSGYCRQIDGSRTVTVEMTDGTIDEADCCYGSCVYQPGCPIAQQIAALAQA